MEGQAPSSGRIVQFVLSSNVTKPAIVHAVHEGGSVDLEVFGLKGFSTRSRFPCFVRSYVDRETGEPAVGTWHWPKRVP